MSRGQAAAGPGLAPGREACVMGGGSGLLGAQLTGVSGGRQAAVLGARRSRLSADGVCFPPARRLP